MPIERTAYLRLTGFPDMERRVTRLVFEDRGQVQESIRRNVGHGRVLVLVPTGDIIWDRATDIPVEVWVPIDRLADWRAQHPGDTP